MPATFDVFVSYHSKDARAVHRVAHELRDERGLQVWLDEWNIAPGSDFQAEISRGLDGSHAMAVFIGPGGPGRWHQQEVRSAVIRAVNLGRPKVIPVYLPGAGEQDNPDDFVLPTRSGVFLTALDDEKGLDKLEWGITGRRPSRDGPRRGPTGVPVDPTTGAAPAVGVGGAGSVPASKAIAKLADAARHGNLVYAVGPKTVPRPDGSPLSRHALVRQMLRELRVLREDGGVLPPLDVSSDYFALRYGAQTLVDRVAEVMMRYDGVPSSHGSMARVLRESARFLRDDQRQIVLTTNLDLLLERSLVIEGLSFTRVVQYAQQQRFDISTYSVRRDGEQVFVDLDGQIQQFYRPAPEWRELDAAIAEQPYEPWPRGDGDDIRYLNVFDLSGIVLYKAGGSFDIPDSCVISAEQHALAIDTWRGRCPESLTRTLSRAAILCLGFCLIDPSFRLLLRTLMRKAYQGPGRFMVRHEPSGDREAERVECALWERILEQSLDMQLRPVAVPCETLLDGLGEALHDEAVPRAPRPPRFRRRMRRT